MHFTVGVISEDINEVESLLEPYNENTDDPVFLAFEPMLTNAEMQEDYAEHKSEYKSIKEYAEQQYDYIYSKGNDNWGYMRNPDSKWDWYKIGGRFANTLLLKDGTKSNSSEISNILTYDENAYRKAARFWEVFVEGDEIRPDEDPKDFEDYWPVDTYKIQYGTKERFAVESAFLTVFAYITPDGVWHERDMFEESFENRMSFAGEFHNALKQHPNCVLTIVDCHD